MERSKFEIGQKLGGGSFGSLHDGISDDLINPGKKTRLPSSQLTIHLIQLKFTHLYVKLKYWTSLKGI